MRKNRMMRLASVLLVCVLLTTSVISGTFAKYTTTAEGTDTARVAKFGVVVQALTNIFDAQYSGNDTVSVLADNGADVIAPGTTGNAVAFTISGSPEVDVRVIADLGDFTRVTLPAGTYLDYTTADTADEYMPTAVYNPVVWTLSKDGTDVDGCVKVGLDVIDSYLTDTLSGKYDVETGAFAAINGTYTLVWEWDFDDNDQADTVLGQIAAGVIAAPDGHEANESFEFSITVEQVD